MLEKAIAIAARAHEGQRDRAGAPCILHPLRVMLAQDDPDARIAAVLHDVVEDSEITLTDLAEAGFSPQVVAAVGAVSRREGETYAEFTDRAGRDPIGRLVKIADLRDNMDTTRIADPGEADAERMERYRQALAKLQALPAT